MNDNGELKVFAGRSCESLCKTICGFLDGSPGKAKVLDFPDGEILVKLEEDVRGRDCYVVLSTSEPVNDRLMELLIWIDCLRRASAGRITCVLPYFGYARQDRKNQGFFPVTANHLSATPVFVGYFQELQKKGELPNLCLVSPDVGNVKVAEGMAKLLGGDLAIIYKKRLSGSTVETGNLIGNVEGKTVLMFDDMISTAGTVCEAAKLLKERGAKDIIAAATHGVLVGPAVERLLASPISRIVVCDTIPLPARVAPLRSKLVELSVGPLLGNAIYRIHNNQSVSALFRNSAGPKR